MNIKNLQFFDYNGYNLNFELSEFGYWEGTIYLPKVSVGLYANTTIYVLEDVGNVTLDDVIPSSITLDKPYDVNRFSNNFVFPCGTGKITFTWDPLNTFVDEFFMFTFDDSYTLKETSSLTYTPNDGPDCETLLVNTFDEYEIPLDNQYTSKPLPIHIGFCASEKYDATTYTRTLIMSYDGKTIARIRFYAETVEEDERLKIWNENLGYNITPEDEMIFYRSDIKEYKPDYILLNEKRKELMMEGSNIYPYIGSYKAIINAIKFFGYENLNIIEYWKNVNFADENFGKIYHSSKYSLTHKETLTIGSRNIVLPNKDYKKINALALVYSINKPTGEIDEIDLPKVKEKFTYTIEEAIIKLFALRKKLNKEFMPGSSKIIDVIGEANYFGLHRLIKVGHSWAIDENEKEFHLDFDVYPSRYVHITDNTYFGKYIKSRKNPDDNLQYQVLSDISDKTLDELDNGQKLSTDLIPLFDLSYYDNADKCQYYQDYYREVYEDHTVYESIENNDDYSYDNPEYDYTYKNDPYARFSAKVVLTNKTFEDVSFGECDLKFGCKYSSINYSDDFSYTINDKTYDDITFGNIDTYLCPKKITWKIRMSSPDENNLQYDDELRNVGIKRTYQYHNLEELDETLHRSNFTITSNLDDSDSDNDDYNQIFVELPYLGYYDVTMELTNPNEKDPEHHIVWSKTKKKCIKVEPYTIEMKGFYYDTRELPKNLQYEMDDNLKTFIQEHIEEMYNMASAERDQDTPIDQSIPKTNAGGETIIPGPYKIENINNEWYLMDNISYELTTLQPLVKYTRYIRNGVDVKPYTWFLLGYEFSKIAGKVKPYWKITNNDTGIATEIGEKKYLTLLLKKEGNYTVTLTLEDKNGNKYEISRNIIVVDKSANYKLYQTFKRDYDYYIEQEMLKNFAAFYTNP